jgi:hypothetical protein
MIYRVGDFSIQLTVLMFLSLLSLSSAGCFAISLLVIVAAVTEGPASSTASIVPSLLEHRPMVSPLSFLSYSEKVESKRKTKNNDDDG